MKRQLNLKLNGNTYTSINGLRSSLLSSGYVLQEEEVYLLSVISDIFTSINEIEIKIENLVKELKASESVKLKDIINEERHIAKTQAASLLQLFNYNPLLKNNKLTPLFCSIEIFIRKELNEMMVAIDRLAFQAHQVKLKEQRTDSANNSIFEKNLMPSICTVTEVASSHLGEKLREHGQLSEEEIMTTVGGYAKMLSSSLYNDEKNSLLAHKHNGMSSHYLQLMETVNQLTEENEALLWQNKEIMENWRKDAELFAARHQEIAEIVQQFQAYQVQHQNYQLVLGQIEKLSRGNESNQDKILLESLNQEVTNLRIQVDNLKNNLATQESHPKNESRLHKFFRN